MNVIEGAVFVSCSGGVNPSVPILFSLLLDKLITSTPASGLNEINSDVPSLFIGVTLEITSSLLFKSNSVRLFSDFYLMLTLLPKPKIPFTLS